MATVINTITGKIGEERDDVIDHPYLGAYLKRVAEGTKALVEGMFKPGPKDQFDADNDSYPDKIKPVKDSKEQPVTAEPIVVETPTEPATDATPEEVTK